MNAFMFASAAVTVSALFVTSLGSASADTTLCSGSALLELCVQKGSPELVVEPVQPGAPSAIGEIQEWARDLSGGTSVHLACFTFFSGTGSCETLASLDFVYVRTVTTVSLPEVDPTPIACPIGVYSATLTVKVLGNGVEDAPFLTVGATC